MATVAADDPFFGAGLLLRRAWRPFLVQVGRRLSLATCTLFGVIGENRLADTANCTENGVIGVLRWSLAPITPNCVQVGCALQVGCASGARRA